MNYFIFVKDEITYDSRDYGIGCGGFPPIVVPKKRITVESLSGRNGSLTTTDDCYDSYTKNIECYMEDDVYKDLSWLSGSGKLILSNELDREYDVTLRNNIELEQIATYWRNFILKFEVQPFKRSRKNNKVTSKETDFSFKSNGNATAFPKILIEGTGNINITLNDSTFMIKNLISKIFIDSELQIAQENNLNVLYKTNGDFPIINPGVNIVHIEGDLQNIEIDYQDTYL